jgi:hypothetical protein
MLASLLLLAAASPALAAPIEVTRFHTPETITALGRGTVVVSVAPGEDAGSLENAVWLAAVQRELAALGFAASTPGAADAVAEVRVERQNRRDEARRGGPVSVGIGGSTGGWNSGVGLGVGFNLGGGARDTVSTRLIVVIRERASGKSLWEGRAENTERTKARAAGAGAGAEIIAGRMTKALFTLFPGTSGATITVK